ncbi:MAG TPA: type II toxin-antitoxin system RelE/ParE family toxin [Sphingomicrobium sp.]|nr:type II toxin-antitoxin system RelE/ParE family toxin [Sphingomicrobium sp.]
MAGYTLSAIADERLDEIYQYSRDNWEDEKAQEYINALFECFDVIAKRDVLWRPIPAEFEVDGYYRSCRNHFVYWREWPDGEIGIVTILHERMHQMDRFRDDLEP